MTREEEIKEARHEWYLRTQDADFCAGFQKGAEWADRTMIDKACEWLLEWETHQGEDIEIVEQFRKAMKSGCSEKPNNCEKGGEQ